MKGTGVVMALVSLLGGQDRKARLDVVSEGVVFERVRVLSDPLAVLRQLESAAPADRTQGFRLLGFNPANGDVPLPPLASISFENLDDDSDLEVLLAVKVVGGSIIFVMDMSQGSWWIIGRFTNGLRNDADGGRVVELRSLVDIGRSEIIVRETDGGTDISETHLSIYRVQSGKLRRVFRTVERARYRVVGVQPAGTFTVEHAWLSYPDRSEVGSSIIVIDRVKIVTGVRRNLLPERRVRMTPGTCEVYRWTEDRQEFIVYPYGLRRFCER